MQNSTRVRFEDRPRGEATMLPNQHAARNYYDWIISQVTPYLNGNILDVGTGYGTHLEYILPHNDRVTSIDFSPTFVELLNERYAEYENYRAICFDFGVDDSRAQLVTEKYDLITCLNVLEHIEDDNKALRDMAEILRGQNGMLFLQVPAHMSLYGTMDKMAGHYRRYTRGEMRQKLEDAGFEPLNLYYFNSFGALPWFINGRIMKPSSMEEKQLSAQLVIYDRFFIPVLRYIEQFIKLPFGQSLLAFARARE